MFEDQNTWFVVLLACAKLININALNVYTKAISLVYAKAKSKH